jgi:hypothetical protein
VQGKNTEPSTKKKVEGSYDVCIDSREYLSLIRIDLTDDHRRENRDVVRVIAPRVGELH